MVGAAVVVGLCGIAACQETLLVMSRLSPLIRLLLGFFLPFDVHDVVVVLGEGRSTVLLLVGGAKCKLSQESLASMNAMSSSENSSGLGGGEVMASCPPAMPTDANLPLLDAAAALFDKAKCKRLQLRRLSSEGRLNGIDPMQQ